MIADLNSGPPEIIGTDPSEGGGGRLLPSHFLSPPRFLILRRPWKWWQKSPFAEKERLLMIADLNSGPPESIGTWVPSNRSIRGRWEQIISITFFWPLKDFWYSGGPWNGDRNHLLRKKRWDINDCRSEFRADGKYRDLRWCPLNNLVKPQRYENYNVIFNQIVECKIYRIKPIYLFKNYSCHFVQYFCTLFWNDITLIWDEKIVYIFNWAKTVLYR